MDDLADLCPTYWPVKLVDERGHAKVLPTDSRCKRGNNCKQGLAPRGLIKGVAPTLDSGDMTDTSYNIEPEFRRSLAPQAKEETLPARHERGGRRKAMAARATRTDANFLSGVARTPASACRHWHFITQIQRPKSETNPRPSAADGKHVPDQHTSE